MRNHPIIRRQGRGGITRPCVILIPLITGRAAPSCGYWKDRNNLKVEVIAVEEGPALGGAILAAVGCGEYKNVQAAAEAIAWVVDTIEPEKELVAKYEEKYQKFKKIYPAVKGLF